MAFAAFGNDQYVLDAFNETIPCEDFPSMLKKNTFRYNKKSCDAYKNLEKMQKEFFANRTEAMAKVGPFKTWILTPASSVWIQFVSVTGMSLTGILLFLYVFNFVAKFSKTSWNFFEMTFCCAMSFCYFTCGLDLFIKGSKLYIPE